MFLSVVQASSPVPGKTPDNPTSTGSEVQDQTKDKNTNPGPTTTAVSQDQPQGHDAHGSEQNSNDAEQPVTVSKLPPVSITKDWTDRFYWLFSGLLVVIGGLQIWLLVRQLNTINRQADIAHNQEVQMVQAGLQTERIIAQMKDTTVRQLRAYVGVSKVLLNLTDSTLPEGQVEVQNFGQTPAYKVRQSAIININSYPPVSPLTSTPFDAEGSISLIPPGIKQLSVVPFKQKLPAGILIGTPENTIYVHGRITYEDAFGQERYATFRFFYGGPIKPTQIKSPNGLIFGGMHPDTTGNNAD
jgi:hypothetical protein